MIMKPHVQKWPNAFYCIIKKVKECFNKRRLLKKSEKNIYTAHKNVKCFTVANLEPTKIILIAHGRTGRVGVNSHLDGV